MEDQVKALLQQEKFLVDTLQQFISIHSKFGDYYLENDAVVVESLGVDDIGYVLGQAVLIIQNYPDNLIFNCKLAIIVLQQLLTYHNWYKFNAKSGETELGLDQVGSQVMQAIDKINKIIEGKDDGSKKVC